MNNYIKQMISKGFALYLYDYKFDDLSVIAYNELLKNIDKYRVRPEFYVINFDDPRRSHRCNPHQPEIHGGHIRRLRIGLHHTLESEQDLDSETG